MSGRKIEILVGLLFLSSTATFLVGGSLIGTYFSSTNPDTVGLVAGVLLEVYTGLAVAAIGVALFPILAPYGRNLAAGYLGLRTVECLVIVAVGVYLVASRNEFGNYDLLVYTVSGAGGLVLSGLLLHSRLVAGWLAVLGIVGYAALLAGVGSDALGLAELDSGLGVAFYVPGGLFELVLPLLLIFKGFAEPSMRGGASSSRAADR